MRVLKKKQKKNLYFVSFMQNITFKTKVFIFANFLSSDHLFKV